MTRKNIFILIFVILLVDSMIVGVLVGHYVSPGAGLLASAGVVALPFVAVPAVMFPMTWACGWRKLARRYPRPDGFCNDSSDKVTSMAMRWWWFGINNAVVIRSDDDYLHLSLHPVFALGTPAIAIPWGEVGTIEDARLGRVRLEVGGMSVWVPEKHVRSEMEVRAAMAQQDTANA